MGKSYQSTLDETLQICLQCIIPRPLVGINRSLVPLLGFYTCSIFLSLQACSLVSLLPESQDDPQLQDVLDIKDGNLFDSPIGYKFKLNWT